MFPKWERDKSKESRSSIPVRDQTIEMKWHLDDDDDDDHVDSCEQNGKGRRGIFISVCERKIEDCQVKHRASLVGKYLRLNFYEVF